MYTRIGEKTEIGSQVSKVFDDIVESIRNSNGKIDRISAEAIDAGIRAAGDDPEQAWAYLSSKKGSMREQLSEAVQYVRGLQEEIGVRTDKGQSVEEINEVFARSGVPLDGYSELSASLQEAGTDRAAQAEATNELSLDEQLSRGTLDEGHAALEAHQKAEAVKDSALDAQLSSGTLEEGHAALAAHQATDAVKSGLGDDILRDPAILKEVERLSELLTNGKADDEQIFEGFGKIAQQYGAEAQVQAPEGLSINKGYRETQQDIREKIADGEFSRQDLYDTVDKLNEVAGGKAKVELSQSPTELTAKQESGELQPTAALG